MSDAAASSGDQNPLLTLLRKCVVRIACDGEFTGTGFFVAPGRVLTCAHVVDPLSEITASRAGWESPAGVLVRVPHLERGSPEAHDYPLPDLAILEVLDPPPRQASVRLTRELPRAGADADALQICGFSKGAHRAGSVAGHEVSAEFESPLVEDEWELLKFKGGQIVHGFSGAPVLNLRSGAVCGFVDSTRAATSSLGGYAVPISVLDAHPLLREWRGDPSADRDWEEALREELRIGARHAGEERRLPILEPMSDLSWSSERAPSDLLKARYGVVALLGRQRLQTELRSWRDLDDRLGIAFIVGGGGYGKTRLGLEECAAAGAEGWTAGLLTLDIGADLDAALDRLVDWEAPLFVAVDYAETRPDVVSALILRLARRGDGPPVRLLLACRQAETRRDLEELFAVRDGCDGLVDLLQGAKLVRLEEDPVDRQDLFERSTAAIADRIGATPPSMPPPALDADHFSRPLFVLAAALLTVTDPEVAIDAMSREALMLELIDRHERRYWQRWSETLETGLDTELQPRVVAMATLLGAEAESEALSLVGAIPGLADLSAERRREVARWLGHLYGDGRLDDGTAISPIEPDMLGEALVGRECVKHPDLIEAAFDAGTDAQLARALTVLARAAAGNEQLAEGARPALGARLPNLVQRASDSSAAKSELAAALELAVTTLRPEAGLDDAVTEVAKAGPTMARLAAALHRSAIDRLKAQGSESPADLNRLAGLLNSLSNALGEIGREGEALEAVEEAVDLWRAIDEEDGRYLPGHAGGLNNLAMLLNRSGQAARALPLIEDSVDRYRRLVRTDRGRYLASLGVGLVNQSEILAGLGEGKRGLSAAEEAVWAYREVVEGGSDEHLLELAMSLCNMANALPRSRWEQEARPLIEEAVEYCHELAEEDWERYRSELATTLAALANVLVILEEREEAQKTIGEAIEIQRELVDEDRQRYLPELDAALTSLTTVFGLSGRREDALAAAEESVNVSRELVALDPERYLPALANSLNNLSTSLRGLNRGEEALATIDAEVARNEAWPGVSSLLLVRADWHFWNGDTGAALKEAAVLLDEGVEAADDSLSDEVRSFLLWLRRKAEDFDSLWEREVGRPPPDWLRDPGQDDDYEVVYEPAGEGRDIGRTVVAWLPTAGDDALRYLEEHAAEMLDPLAEKALLKGALLAPEHPGLIARVGILTLARMRGPAAAFELASDLRSFGDLNPLDAGDDPETLAIARMCSGLIKGDPDAQLLHAITATVAGQGQEAGQAVERWRKLASPEERTEGLAELDRLIASVDGYSAELEQLRANLG